MCRKCSSSHELLQRRRGDCGFFQTECSFLPPVNYILSVLCTLEGVQGVFCAEGRHCICRHSAKCGVIIGPQCGLLIVYEYSSVHTVCGVWLYAPCVESGSANDEPVWWELLCCCLLHHSSSTSSSSSWCFLHCSTSWTQTPLHLATAIISCPFNILAIDSLP